MSETRKLILVIGATGGQGTTVLDALLAPSEDGTPSPYAVRALTRDPSSARAKALEAKGVECVKGSVDNFVAVQAAFKGVYGAYVNTDGFTLGEQKETYCGMRIFEIAKATPSMRHYVWSGLDYATKKGGWKPEYKVDHFNGKGRVSDWLKAQPSVVSDSDMSWSVLTSGPYMDMLYGPLIGPMNKRPDGTTVFAAPIGDGHIPMIALSDLGIFARYIYDHRHETSAQDLEVASELVSWQHLAAAFTRVTGQPAVYKRLSVKEWLEYWIDTDLPIASDMPKGQGHTTVAENFSGFFSLFRDDVIKRDMEWVKAIHPKVLSVEGWMRENSYRGLRVNGLLKNQEDGSSNVKFNREAASHL